MRRTTTFFCTIFFVWCAGIARGQEESFHSWTNFSNTKEITAFEEDGSFLWIGTEGGLVKVNKATGTRTIYTCTNSGLASNHISALRSDHSGALWIGTSAGILAKYFEGNWTYFDNTNSGNPGYEIRSLCVDRAGKKWIGTLNGLICFNDSAWTTSLQSYDIRAICQDRNNNMWIAASAGLFKMDSAGVTAYSLFSYYDELSDIKEDPAGNLWISSRFYGVAKYDGTRFTYFTDVNSGLPSNWVNSIAIDKNGIPWVTSGGALAELIDSNWVSWTSHDSPLPEQPLGKLHIDSNNKKWISISHNYDWTYLLYTFDGIKWNTEDISYCGLPDNNVRAFAFDHNENLWIGTTKGVAEFDGLNWIVYDSLNPVSLGNNIYAIAVDKNDLKWIGGSAGLECFNGSFVTIFDRNNSPLPASEITSVVVSENNTKWIGTVNGLVKLDSTGWTLFNHFNSGLPYDQISCISIDRSGRKWIGTMGGGLVVYNDTNWRVFDRSNSPFTVNNVFSVSFDSHNKAWVATSNEIAVFDGSGWIAYNSTNSPLPTFIMYMYVDNNDVKWITGIHQLLKFNDAGWTLVKTLSPGSNYNIFGVITGDSKNDLFIGGNSGLFIFNEGGIALSQSEEPPITSLMVSPNPSTGRFTIKGDLISAVCVYNVYGECAFSQNFIGQSENEIQIDLSRQSKGIYFVRINGERENVTRKIIIQ
ncbi:MAG TPA: two-component regulator propeller domain-containing protein [Bacteroidia bacterium]